jgi:hypothetical protein
MPTVKELLEDDPGRLVQDATLFEFNEVPGHVKLIDGWAAGGAWQVFEFVDGPFVGRTISCAADRLTFEYRAHCNDDGFLFNRDPAREVKDTETECPGGFYPEWDEMIFTIKET